MTDLRRTHLRGCSWILALAPALLGAAPVTHPTADAQALDLVKQAIAMRSVHGSGNQTPQVAALFRDALISGGFSESDVVLTPVDDTAYLIARWPGSDSTLKPLVISGHMDVVEAKPADWQRDPFKPVIENGVLFGRGASDMKLDDTLVIAAVVELRRAHYRPKRDIVLAFSGDEETNMKTSAILAQRLNNAELVLNADGAGGLLDPDGKAVYLTWQGAEKTYADFELTVTNPGGHSSAPREDNAIAQLSAALVKIGSYRFKPELNEITRGYFSEAARYEQPSMAAAMRAFVADPTDAQAVAALRANPSQVGRIGTTCIPTMVNGGHALNAQPQRATANINCRIFPGHSPADILEELRRAVNDPVIVFNDVSQGSVMTDASPVRPALVAAVNKAIHLSYPHLPVFPSMSSGASDSMWFRHEGIPSYGISPLFSKVSDRFSHGLNERIQLDNITPSITYFLSLFTDLSK